MALNRALTRAAPEIFNTDQGAQFTSEAFTGRLAEAGVRISMDGRGRTFDNIMIEQLWRSVKYEDDGSIFEGLRESQRCPERIGGVF